MSRKPAPLELAGGKGQRQRIWEAIRRQGVDGAIFTEDDISRKLLDVELDIIRDYRRALQAAGVIAVVTEHTPQSAASYQLKKDCGMDAPRLRKDGTPVTQGLAQEQMWRTLRMLTGLDINAREMAAHASTPAIAVAEVAAKHYFKALFAAGYLLRTREGKSGLQARYRLKPARNTGPRPPMVCRTKVVWDANEHKIVWQPPVSEEDAIYGK